MENSGGISETGTRRRLSPHKNFFFEILVIFGELTSELMQRADGNKGSGTGNVDEPQVLSAR